MTGPQESIADKERMQYLILLAAACSRDEEDLLDFHLAHHLGYDVYVQRFAHFDDLVRVERLRRGIGSSAGPLSLAQRQELAKDRATALLLDSLSACQRHQYKDHRYFDVIGGESGKRYRIWHRTMQNIEELGAQGERRCIWCVHPADVPLCDVLLAQKIALESFERDALRIANGYSDWPTRCGDDIPAIRMAVLAPYRALAGSILPGRRRRDKRAWRCGWDALKELSFRGT